MDDEDLKVEPHFLPSATSAVLVIRHQSLRTVEAAQRPDQDEDRFLCYLGCAI